VTALAQIVPLALAGSIVIAVAVSGAIALLIVLLRMDR
jgi:hypothetical protein